MRLLLWETLYWSLQVSNEFNDVQRTSDLVREAIAHVRDNHPYWNASGGADHFMVFSYDHGKCEMAKALQFEEFGKMFSVQAYGSLVYRCSSAYPLDSQLP